MRAEPVNPIAAVGLGIQQCWIIVETTLSYIGRVAVQRESADQLGGPLMIAQVSGQVATLGVAAFMHFVAVLSVSIGLLNLFPVPLLDGGHLLFYAAEVLLGRPLSERAQEIGFRIGFVLVVADDLRDQERHLPFVEPGDVVGRLKQSGLRGETTGTSV